MDSVVYWLGAGFSAPLGLPVMGDFLLKSKDQYASDPEQYEHFGPIFKRIDELSKVKNFFRADLYNIEEILSLLEMNTLLRGIEREWFFQYIRDVISFHTPQIQLEKIDTGSWFQTMWGTPPRRYYGAFITSLLNRRAIWFPGSTDAHLIHENASASNSRYAVISMNYDLVLEKFAEIAGGPFAETQLIKLHGSVDGDIVPPTWNKSLHPEIEATWKLAHQLLSSANHIRFIGYSLPESDLYVRFLLKSAALESDNLKKIDVICLDDHQGSVQKRYRDFIEFPMFRFVSAYAENYLERITPERKDRNPQRGSPLNNESIEYPNLESAHEQFFVSGGRG